ASPCIIVSLTFLGGKYICGMSLNRRLMTPCTLYVTCVAVLNREKPRSIATKSGGYTSLSLLTSSHICFNLIPFRYRCLLAFLLVIKSVSILPMYGNLWAS